MKIEIYDFLFGSQIIIDNRFMKTNNKSAATTISSLQHFLILSHKEILFFCVAEYESTMRTAIFFAIFINSTGDVDFYFFFALRTLNGNHSCMRLFVILNIYGTKVSKFFETTKYTQKKFRWFNIF